MAATPSAIPPGRGLLRVVTGSQLAKAEKDARVAKELEKADQDSRALTGLASHIRKRFEQAKRHRTTSLIDDKLIAALRAREGEYDPEKKAQIAQFGGSDVYARITAVKCRGATALLRDVYMSGEKPWAVEATADPTIPDSVAADIGQLVSAEVLTAARLGAAPEPAKVDMRREQLYDAAKKAEIARAGEEAKEADRKIEDMLQEGGFYHAFNEFLADLPVFKYAVLKGPTVRNAQKLQWADGKMDMVTKPGYFWDRVSPFDVWFSPGAQNVANSETFERQRFTVAQLYELIGLPGYKEDAIRDVIGRYDTDGLREWGIMFDTERNKIENRGDLTYDSLIDCIEFQGMVLGKHLKDYEVKGVTDDEKPYFITAWLIDRQVIKVMLNPNPRRRPNYFVTSYDKIPGSIAGNGLTDLLEDIQNVSNACLRALVNNLSIASGPQVFFDEELLSPTQDDSLHPWKRWRYVSDPARPNAVPIGFFQPQSNANELLGVFERMNVIGDEVSAIPRFMTGNSNVGGAGRTSSGLAMLMNNANKTLQNVAENVDMDVMQPAIQSMYDLLMLTDDSGMLRGDESIVVKGVRKVAKQEQDRVRQLEFLQLTANPIDAQIVGAERARIVQQVADKIGLDVDIPDPGDGPPPGPSPGDAGPSFNGGANAAPDGSVSDNAQPRLQTQALNTVSARNNVG